ncbi:phosphotransferase [Tepidibacillus marianensis]|uniref:phosphotransferase n=1 Tax=Tepidibacillus marianensis TaxID=3131995 RepID=UPI0030D259B7
MAQHLPLEQIQEKYDFAIENWEYDQNVYRLHTNRGKKLLKLWNDYDTLTFAFQLREHLAHHGFRTIDRFIRTQSGEPFVSWNDEYLVVTDWLDGSIPQVTDELDITKISKLTAKLHLSLAKMEVAQDWEPWSNQFERSLFHFNNVKDKITAKSKTSPFDELVLSHIDSNQEQVKQSVLMANKVEKNGFRSGREPQWCHGNLHLRHFRIDSHHEPWLIHFDIPVYDTPVYDLAKILVHLYIKSNYQDEPIFQALNAYQEIVPLQKEEQLWILTYLTFPHHLWKYLYICYLSGLPQTRFSDEQQYIQLIDLQKQQEGLYRSLYQYFGM